MEAWADGASDMRGGQRAMGKIVRHEFVGNKWLLFLLFLFGITFPFALIYFFESLVTVVDEIDDPEKFMEVFRSGKIGRG
jgi:hypothetical protein